MPARTATVFAVLLAIFLPGAARAMIGTIDDVPAATLLLPYFEVDAARVDGVTTLFSINNASATAVLAHVTVWTDLSYPVLDFNVYLTGYDVLSLNLRDILNGVLPQTASAGQDPGDTISPQGPFSQDINFASCNGLLPPPAQLPANFVADLQSALRGEPSTQVVSGCAAAACCAAQNFGDNILRGYVTVDTVNNCSLRFPADLGYFGGDATDQNVLWGDYFYVNAAENYAQGETLVHIEASATSPQTTVPGQYTFYGRYLAWQATDHREPVASEFAVRYLNGGPFDAGSRLIVWRDSKATPSAIDCGISPVWFPLGQENITIYDEQEHAQALPAFPVSPQPPNASFFPFPAEAQSTRVGGPDLPVPFPFGWIYIDLDTVVVGADNHLTNGPEIDQGWVTWLAEDAGRFSVGIDAVKIRSASAKHQTQTGHGQAGLTAPSPPYP